MNHLFPNIIGQEKAKKLMGFTLDVYQKQGIFRKPVLFTGPRGVGKTTVALSLAAKLKTKNETESKPAYESNGASLTSVSIMVDSIIQPHVGERCTIFIDEVHAMAHGPHNWLLSVLAPDSQTLTSRNSHRGMDFEFDFREQTFIMATTNPEKLSDAFLSRCDRIDLAHYTLSEMEKIVMRHAKDVSFSEEALREVASVCRGTARFGKDYAGKIKDYLTLTDQENEEFTIKDWKALKYRLGVYPMGLLEKEVQALRVLNASGPLQLKQLAFKLQMDPATVSRNVEVFLIENGYMGIDGTRHITTAGQDILKQIH